MPIQPPTHRLFPTPNPSFWSLRVEIEQSVLVADPEIIPAEGALYKDFKRKIFSKDWLKKYGEYRYVSSDSGSAAQPVNAVYPSNSMAQHKGEMEDATVSLLFLPTLTDEQRNTPYRSTWSFGDHYWHPILESLIFYEDKNFPRTTNGGRGGQTAIITGPTYYVREVYRPSVTEGSRFFTEEFFSDVPYDIPYYPVPIPTAVSYDLPGVRGSFPECLHPKIIVPATQTADASFVLGLQGGASGVLQGQLFPATNFTEWEPYVVAHQQNFQNGYLAKRVTVYPPLENERIRR